MWPVLFYLCFDPWNKCYSIPFHSLLFYSVCCYVMLYAMFLIDTKYVYFIDDFLLFSWSALVDWSTSIISTVGFHSSPVYPTVTHYWRITNPFVGPSEMTFGQAKGGICNVITHTKILMYSWTSLCRSGRDPEKYFDIGMVRDNHLDIMGSETFWQNISFKKNDYLQSSFNHFTITYFVHWII